jgi:lipopolysaccharide export system protein LptA
VRPLLATCVLAACALAAASAAFAEKADRDKPTQVQANRMNADDARRMNIFEGNVVMTKGTINLRADRVVVRQDAEGYQYASATGRPVCFRQRQDAKPGEKEGVWLDGEALRIEIDDRASTVKLFESARVNRGGDEVSGNYILVDQRSSFFQVTAGKDPGGDKERVTVTIQPGKAAVEQAKQPPRTEPGKCVWK